MKKHHFTLLMISLLVAITAAVDPIWEYRLVRDWRMAYEICLTILFLILVVLWCLQFARAKQVSPVYGKIPVVLLSFLGMPYYFIRNFGWKQGGIYVGIEILFVLFMFALYVTVFLLMAIYVYDIPLTSVF